MKRLAMLAVTGVALSFAYTLPAMADDLNNTTAAQSPAQAIPAPAADNNMQNMQTAANAADQTATPPASNIGSSVDEGTPDTATGDDDY